MFCVYKTDPDWIRTLRTLSSDVQVNFWRRGTNHLRLPFGSWLYFNERRTRNIIGRGMLVGYEILPLNEAWKKFGIGNGVASIKELEQRAAKVLGVIGESSQIGCIVLSELEFLPLGDEYSISSLDYPSQIVGPKYFNDDELPELTEKFNKVSSYVNLLKERASPEYSEGKESFSYRVGYERNPEARKACLAHHGFSCLACKVDLQLIYGAIAKDFIHVHHLNPISQVNEPRKVNPITDLVPLCPNCHAIAHRRVPPFSLEEVKEFLERNVGLARLATLFLLLSQKK